uniref:Uncharacterized protein n=1 Tax=Arundo donax TaxID=35708 RepID=A0A0A9NVP4_ARUDO
MGRWHLKKSEKLLLELATLHLHLVSIITSHQQLLITEPT